MSLRACIDFCAAAQNSLSDRLPTLGISRSITNLGIVDLLQYVALQEPHVTIKKTLSSILLAVNQASLVGSARWPGKLGFSDYNSRGRIPCPSAFLFSIGLSLARSWRSEHLVCCYWDWAAPVSGPLKTPGKDRFIPTPMIRRCWCRNASGLATH